MPLVRKPSPAAAATGTPDRDEALRALESGTASARWSAARVLAGFAEAVPALARALGTEADPRVRSVIFTSLIQLGGTASVRAIFPYLRATDAGLRSGARDALKAMPLPTGACLAELLEDPDPHIRLLACELAQESPSPETARLLAEVLERDPAVNVCAAALEALGDIGGPEVLPALERCAERFAEQPFIRFSADTIRARIGRRP